MLSVSTSISISLYTHLSLLNDLIADSTVNVHLKSLNAHARLVSILWLFKAAPYDLFGEVRVRSRLLVTPAAFLLSHGRGRSWSWCLLTAVA